MIRQVRKLPYAGGLAIIASVLKGIPVSISDNSLVHLLLLLILFCHNPFERANLNIKSSSTNLTPIHHVLSLLQQSYKPEVDDDVALRLHYGSSKILSALDLDICGLNFKPNDKTWVLGMEMKLNRPIRRMPVFHIHYHTEKVLKSIIAYEQQSCAPHQRYTTSFVYAMGMLKRTAGDVVLLVKSEVLVMVVELREIVEETTCARQQVPVDEEACRETQHFCPSYYRVPNTLLQIWGTASFQPEFVYVGPTHRKDASLSGCKALKKSYMNNLLRRVLDATGEEVSRSCFRLVHSSLEMIKLCYGWTDNDGDDDELADMMVTDACFILDFMLEIMVYVDNQYLGMPKRHGAILADLVLLGNQIPFFVLKDIFECTLLRFIPRASLVDHLLLPILTFHNPFNRANIDIIDGSSTDPTPIHHLLSLLQQSYKPEHVDDDDATFRLHYGSSKVRSALDLEICGVNFKPNDDDATWVLGMELKLNRRPVLRMPVFRIHYHTEKILKSIVAYEKQSCAPRQRYTTSFVYVMGMLGRTAGDVALLGKSKVLFNFLGSDDEAATMIQHISKHISKQCEGSLYEDKWKLLNKYRIGFENRRTFFSNPWNVIALVLGIILLAFNLKKLLN
ncbi:hypothetical protein SSX86_022252 [Deinandra increscens subsp. villosa]|uniref:Uncharacterized protein n=1 Tax=Deinandra increscens subsp. villosa TaxID=3103831 RepID=A0AAP0GQY7_9ASTR